MSEARAPTPAEGSAGARSDAFRRFIARPEAPALVFLAVLLVVFSLSSDKFLSGSNLESILTSVAVLGTIALAVNQVILDRKSTRLNSSHANISYAVFCLKKKI